jgi:hypothetical protein
VKLSGTCSAYFDARYFLVIPYRNRPYDFREKRQAELSGTFLPFALFAADADHFSFNCSTVQLLYCSPRFIGGPQVAADKFPHAKRFKPLHYDTVFVHNRAHIVQKPPLFDQ